MHNNSASLYNSFTKASFSIVSLGINCTLVYVIVRVLGRCIAWRQFKQQQQRSAAFTVEKRGIGGTSVGRILGDCCIGRRPARILRSSTSANRASRNNSRTSDRCHRSCRRAHLDIWRTHRPYAGANFSRRTYGVQFSFEGSFARS